MPILSILVPCYNSQDYMRTAVESLLPAKEDLDIIIVNDGSTDNTESIGREYEKKYPETIRFINQTNKGHGGAVNTGILHAKGDYFKVLDSDDRLEEQALIKAVDTLKKLKSESTLPDLFITNFVYDKKDKKLKKTMRFSKIPKNRIFKWEAEFQVGDTEYITMHSIMYKTEILRKIGLVLPEKISYEDDIYAFTPMSLVDTVYYLDTELYMYFIGRDDQSVNESVMIKKRAQYEKITRIILDDYFKMENLGEKKKKYLIKFLDMMMTLASIVLILSGTPEDYKAKDKLWQDLKAMDKELYEYLSKTMLGRLTTLGRAGRVLALGAYKTVQKIVGFN